MSSAEKLAIDDKWVSLLGPNVAENIERKDITKIIIEIRINLSYLPVVSAIISVGIFNFNYKEI